MFVGGGISSTVGEITIYRLLVLFKAMQMFLRRASSGVHSQLHLRLDGKRVDYLIIEKEQDKIDMLSQYINCGFILGDDAKSKFLEKACAKNTDALICLSDSDTDNLLAAQVVKSMGFKRVIVRVEDDELEPVCHNFQMEGVIFTNKQLTREIVNMSELQDGMLRSAYLDGELQFVELKLDDNCPKMLSDIDFPKQCQFVTVNNGEQCRISADVDSLNAGDRLLFVTTHETYLNYESAWV